MQPRAHRAEFPDATFSLSLTQNPGYSGEWRDQATEKDQSFFLLPGGLTPVETFDLLINKHTLLYFVFPGIDFRSGRRGMTHNAHKKKNAFLHKQSRHPTQRAATPFPAATSMLTGTTYSPSGGRDKLKQLRHAKLLFVLRTICMHSRPKMSEL